MMKSMKKMVLVGAAVTVMVVSLAAPAMADEVQEQSADPPVKDPGIRLCDIAPPGCQNTEEEEEKKAEEEDRLKDPGIRLCDISPTECPNTAEEDSAHKTPRGSGGEYPEYCKLPSFMYDPACDKKNNEHNDKDEYSEYCKLPTFAYDPACDKKNNEHSQDSNDSQDEQGS